MSEGYILRTEKPDPPIKDFLKSYGWLVTLIVMGISFYGEKQGWWTAEQGAMIRTVPLMEQQKKQPATEQAQVLADDLPTPAPALLPVAQIDVIDVAGKSLDVSTGSIEVPANIPVIITASNSVRSTLAWGRTKTAGHAIAIPDGWVLVPSPGESTTFFLAVQSGDVLATTQLLVTCELAPNPPPDDEPIPDNGGTILERLDRIDQRLTALERGKVEPEPEPEPIIVGQKFNVQVIYDVHDKVTDRSVKTSTVTSSAAYWNALRLRGHTATIHPTGTHNEQAQDAIRWAAAKGRAPPLLAVRKADGTIVDVVALPGTTADVDAAIRAMGGV